MSWFSESFNLNLVTASTAVGAVLLASYFWKRGTKPRTVCARHVVIIGGLKGIGKAFADKHRACGDFVVVTSSQKDQTEGREKENVLWLDVRDRESVGAALAAAKELLGGHVDLIINMAGVTQKEKGNLFEVDPKEMENIVLTNILGTLNVAAEAAKIRCKHLILCGGAGTRREMTTPTFATYGFSKAGMSQLTKTLAKENQELGIGVHLIVPGMAITDLLDPKSKSKDVRRIFNILAELPEEMAEFFVPKLRSLEQGDLKSRQWDYLTPLSVVWRFLTARWRKNRLIDDETGELI
jgi:3-oxoacyl-[acyl-carrier protein] reductase